MAGFDTVHWSPGWWIPRVCCETSKAPNCGWGCKSIPWKLKLSGLAAEEGRPIKVTFTCSIWTLLWPYPNPRSTRGGTRKSLSKNLNPRIRRTPTRMRFQCQSFIMEMVCCREPCLKLMQEMTLDGPQLLDNNSGIVSPGRWNLWWDTLFYRSIYYVHTLYIYIYTLGASHFTWIWLPKVSCCMVATIVRPHVFGPAITEARFK